MSKSKGPTDLSLLVSHILLNHWDPLSVAKTPEAHGEYDAYVSTICRMIVDGVDATQLRAHLIHAETVNMGLSRRSRNLDRTVQRLIELTER